MRAAAAGLVFLVFAGTVLPAQATTSLTPPPTADRRTFDVGGGMSRYGPHAFGGLEMAMNRWLAFRGEALFSTRDGPQDRDYRSTALSLTSVLTLNREARVAPYVFGGYGASVSQGHQLGFVPLGGAGLRVRVWRIQPFAEVRAHRGLGVPISLGLRF
jgi:hypothetical protein